VQEPWPSYLTLLEDEVRSLDGSVLQLHHELPVAAPFAARRPGVLVAVCARVVGEATLARDGLLYAVHCSGGVAWYGFRLGVAIGEDVEALSFTVLMENPLHSKH
jgi:hypothetical protein